MFAARADWPCDPGDERILATASSRRPDCCTLDKDFGTLAFLRNLPHHGIIRLVDVSATRQAAACQGVVERYADVLEKRAAW